MGTELTAAAPKVSGIKQLQQHLLVPDQIHKDLCGQ